LLYCKSSGKSVFPGLYSSFYMSTFLINCIIVWPQLQVI
jgi:hypothetical protein